LLKSLTTQSYTAEMPDVGITSWLKSAFLGGIAFRRKWVPGQASSTQGKKSGLSAGRVVDRLFKRWADKKSLPSSKSKCAKVCNHAVSALRSRKIRPVCSNAFVRYNGIKSHIDGLGATGATTVIIELKSTTKSIDAQQRAYHTPCQNQPTVGQYANTEYTHHMLQLGWTTLAYRIANPDRSVIGIVLIAAEDGARIVPLDESFARKSTWDKLIASKFQASGISNAIKSLPYFPDDAVAVVEAAAGVKKCGMTGNKRILALSCGGAAVASLKLSGKLSIAEKKKIKEAVGNASPVYCVFPGISGWKARPVIFANKAGSV
jgi:hypothetical protein